MKRSSVVCDLCGKDIVSYQPLAIGLWYPGKRGETPVMLDICNECAPLPIKASWIRSVLSRLGWR